MANNLEVKTVKELEAICKELGLTYYVGKKHLTKQEMLDKINSVSVKEPEPVVENPTNDVTNVDPESFCNLENRGKYIEEAEVGTLVAFIDEKGKPRTAAIVNRSSKRRMLKVQTEFGWEFIVPYEKVLWVKKGTRWPKGVYNLLKGYNKNVNRDNNNE